MLDYAKLECSGDRGYKGRHSSCRWADILMLDNRVFFFFFCKALYLGISELCMFVQIFMSVMVLMAFSSLHIQENGTTRRKTNPSGRTSESHRKGSQGKCQKVIKTNSLHFLMFPSFITIYSTHLRDTVRERRWSTHRNTNERNNVKYMAAVVPSFT